MRIIKNKFYTSPSDLNNFVSCKYLIKNEIKFLNKEIKKNEESFDQKLWKEFGLKHEKKHFKLLSAKHKKNISIKQDLDEKERNKQTLAAIKKGYDLIYHAYLIDEDFRGECDFLIKSSMPSDLGDFSYEVYDTKISRKPRPRHIFQITSYSHMLSTIQGVVPEKMYLIDGTNETRSYKTKEYLDFYLFTKKNFEKYLKNISKEKIYPEKCDHCEMCNFADECEKIWENDNYINQVAKINRSQIEKLKKIGIKTVDGLAKCNPDKIKIKINKQTLKDRISQAELQEEKRKTGKSRYIILNPDIGKGFYNLPKPDEGDLFYDIESFPQEDGRGFEYLHGIYYKNGKNYEFKPFWAKDFEKKYEKENYIELIKFFKSHFNKHPKAHIYHYANYEKRSLRQLASLYSSDYPEGYNFVDTLLREEKFVDLRLIINQSARTSEKDMSLKSIEGVLYNFNRKGDVKRAEDSVRLYDFWSATKDEKTKKDIIEYNEEDCVSTFHLRDFLVSKKPESIDWFSKKEKPEKPEKKYQNKKPVEEWEKVEVNLLKSLEKKNLKDNPLTETIRNLIGFHRREQKPEFWAIYDRKKKSHDELEDDPECIGQCVLQSSKPEKIEKNLIFTYQFNDQDYKLKANAEDYVHDAHSRKNIGKINEIIENSPNKNLIKIKITDQSFKKIGEMPSIVSLSRRGPPGIQELEKALNRFVNDYINNKGLNYKAIMDLLERGNPNLKNIKSGNKLIDENKDITNESITVVKQMDQTCLSIQGPPGTGKTYTSAKVIIELMKDNKKVGVSSNSHEAIKNLLSEIERQAKSENFKFKGMKKSKNSNLFNGEFIVDIIGRYTSEQLKDFSLVAGTAWFFSDERLKQTLDYLFVDEAGQVSLANTISMATSTKNLVLIGDQMQLSQPLKGTHEGYAKLSSLDFILEDKDTIPPEQGIFLRETRRLNEKICKYISESFYDSRLVPHEVTKKRKIKLELNDIRDEGIFYMPSEHFGNSQRSDEEAEIIHNYYSKIIGKNYEDEKAKGKIDIKNIMVVAPFNVQANNIKQKLLKKFSKDTRVGTIDLFQGQEAKVVLISMTSSDAENLPRHKGFFFSRNRLNVAVSRAQNVAIILMSPKLLMASANTIEQMKLINNFCKLLTFKIKK